MKNIIIEKVEEQIVKLLERLDTLEAGTEEFKEVAESINKLYGTLNKEKELEFNQRKLSIESVKIEGELELKERQQDIDSIRDSEENELKIKTLRDSKIWNGTKVGLDVLAVVAPLVFYGIWMNRGLEFEKEGTFTSTTFKGLFGKFKPNK